ncbi:hypothetical protein SODALDRAFT_376566 [Sodiomyces alkalinus F11]|uniref:NB-ARC domain-containing protein n=1 Tax=Sodiomyces alkalinus (strain CBS 110278 / VKM F-3762 / F11) TaxID=1314773 RepID=A0A3N2Q250_SODAK|nr:hypothetical protein SODALDRAFT_376566 [Sodiomyces alkalinus F11]ROT40812.1 hypothetical protein SODALDRAFT_376566 [Sodiomyces alkalinus F11]
MSTQKAALSIATAAKPHRPSSARQSHCQDGGHFGEIDAKLRPVLHAGGDDDACQRKEMNGLRLLPPLVDASVWYRHLQGMQQPDTEPETAADDCGRRLLSAQTPPGFGSAYMSQTGRRPRLFQMSPLTTVNRRPDPGPGRCPITNGVTARRVGWQAEPCLHAVAACRIIMEGLGVAANVIAVVDLSVKVATLCLQYSREVEHLGTALRAAQHLLEGNNGQPLSTSRGLVGSFRDCIAELKRLEKKLGPNTARTAIRRFGFRALRWPFSSKEVDQLLASLERHERTILLGLQIDQTAILVGIQEGVRRLGLQPTEDASISRNPHCMVPFPPDPDFVHRPAIEEWMQAQYSQTGRRLALVGMGGFGKSQLAIEFAHRVHADNPGTSVFWVYGSARATFEESYRALADVLALPRRHEPEVDVLALVRDWLQRDDISPWFMVVDNADDTGVFFLDNGHDAPRLNFLRKRLEGKPDEAAAMNLARALDFIPLAVNQAAVYINRRSPRVTTESYLEEFLRSEKRKDSLFRSDKGDLGGMA